MYGIGFLDDIHNYFPALLYDTESFLTAQDVLRYVRNRTIQRFNVYDNARAEYHTNQLNARLETSSLRNFNTPQDIIREYTNPPPLFPPVALANSQIPTGPPHRHVHILRSSQPIIHGTDFSALFPLLRSLEALSNTYDNEGLEGLEAPVLPPRLYEDVVVHATQEVIDHASRVSVSCIDLENNCSICQDRFIQNDIIRTLTGCGHDFHRECIDPWLLTRSTICPICRHDIRETDILVPGIPVVGTPAVGTPAVAPPDETDDQFINLLFGRTF